MCVVHTVYYCCTGRNLYKISTNFYLYKFPMVNGVGKNKTNRISFTTYGDVTSNNICCLFGIFFRSLHSVCVPSFISSRRCLVEDIQCIHVFFTLNLFYVEHSLREHLKSYQSLWCSIYKNYINRAIYMFKQM